MKNILKIGALSVALLAAVMIINTNAQTDTTQMNLTINGGTSTCTIDDSTLTISGLQASYAEQVTQGSFSTGGIHCEDMEGASTWNLAFLAQDLINTTDPTKVIDSATSIRAQGSNEVMTGSCAHGSMLAGWLDISASEVIFSKTNAVDICDLSTDMAIQVTVPANQAVGLYQGNLEFTATNIAL